MLERPTIATKHQTPNGWIECVRMRNCMYARLGTSNSAPRTYLGPIPDSPTGLLDLALDQAPHLKIDLVYRLMAANKQARW